MSGESEDSERLLRQFATMLASVASCWCGSFLGGVTATGYFPDAHIDVMDSGNAAILCLVACFIGLPIGGFAAVVPRLKHRLAIIGMGICAAAAASWLILAWFAALTVV